MRKMRETRAQLILPQMKTRNLHTKPGLAGSDSNKGNPETRFL